MQYSDKPMLDTYSQIEHLKSNNERYVFLTRKSDGEVKQVFNISEELYQSLLRNHDDILRVKYEHGRYKIIHTI